MTTQHPALDLFGEVPVYRQDIDAWLIAVPCIEPGTKRAAHYVEAWNVIEKIKVAKLAGTFDARVSRPEPANFWWNRFSWART